MVSEQKHPPGSSLVSMTPSRAAVTAERRSFAPLVHGRVTFPFVTRSRRELAVTLTARAIFDLKRAVVVGQRLDRAVRHCGCEAAPAWTGGWAMQAHDLKRLDLQTLHHGVELLAGEGEGVGVVPAFWRTVGTAAGRMALLYADLEPEARAPPLLVEVFGAEHASTRQIRDVTSHLEAQRRGVIVHVSPVIDEVRRLAEAEPPGLAVDFARVETCGARAWEGAAELILAARASAPSVLLLNLPPERGEAAAAMGATHAIFAAMDRLIV